MPKVSTWNPTMPQASTRWVVYGMVVALMLIAVRVADQREGRVAVTGAGAQAARSDPDDRARSAIVRVPDLELARLSPRRPLETDVNLFGASWAEREAEEARRNVPPPPTPPPPQAPPLPFAFMGKLVDDGNVIAFLVKDDRNYVVRRGDLIDGTYRVEEISEVSLTFSYLPLDLRQSLALGDPVHTVTSGPLLTVPAAAVPPTPAAAAGPPIDPTKLVWIAPPKVAIGEEFTIMVGLPPGAQPRSGRVELVYDARVLAVLGGAAPGASSGSATARRAIVDVIGPGFPGAPPTPSEVRFRVLAADPTNTQIGIENLSAVAASRPLVLVSPATHQLVVQAQGLRSESN